MIWIVIGAISISLATTYAWWVKVRAIAFRQDIFDIRDDLFDAALAADGVGDDAHIAARRHLNSLANSVNGLSIMLLGYVLSRGVDTHSLRSKLNSSNVALNAAIEGALSRSTQVFAEFLLHKTMPGVLLSAFSRVVRASNVVEGQVTKWSTRWTMSESPENLSRTA